MSDPTMEPDDEQPRPDRELGRSIQLALDALLEALALEPTGADRFAVDGEPGRFARVFGGQTIAQALVAASATVDDKALHSLHAYFVEAGTPGGRLDLVVDRVRDGRSMATRRVTVTEGDRPLLVAIASFHANATAPDAADPAPAFPAPEEVRVLQDWIPEAPPELAAIARGWIDQPPPVELRIGEAPSFMGGPPGRGARSHWMRAPRDLGDDAVLHAALLAYTSDYFLLDMAFRAHPTRPPITETTSCSLDHTVWLHRPVRFDQWHLHTQELVALSGDRGLVRGAIHDRAGRLVANVMQEVLVRLPR